MRKLLVILLSCGALISAYAGSKITQNTSALILGKEENHFAATESEIKKAPCRRVKNYTFEELETRIRRSYQGHPVVEGKIFDSMIRGNQKELQMIIDFIGEDPADLVGSCETTKCVLSSYFSKVPETIPYLQVIYLEFGLNPSPYAAGKQRSEFWKKGELEDVLKALDSLPKTILPFMDRNKQFQRFKRGTSLRALGPHAIANASMTFFDPWEKLSAEYRQYAIIHEIGHNFDDLFFQEELWNQYTRNYARNFVSTYSRTNRSEEFAEIFSSYRFSPQHLKAKVPSMYIMMKTIFDGVEYLSENTCVEKTDSQKYFDSTVETYMENTSVSHSKEEQSFIFSSCRDSILKLATRDHFSISLDNKEVDQCFAKAIIMNSSFYPSFSSKQKAFYFQKNIETKVFTDHEKFKELKLDLFLTLKNELKLAFQMREKRIFDELQYNDMGRKQVYDQGFCSYWSEHLIYSAENIRSFFSAPVSETYFNDYEEVGKWLEPLGKSFCEKNYGIENGIPKSLSEDEFQANLEEFFYLNH